MGFIIGQWQNPLQSIDAKQIARDLGSVAEQLDAPDPQLSGCQMGFHNSGDIATAGHLAEVLALQPGIGSMEAAQQFLADFLERARDIALASRVASVELQFLRGKPGRPAHDWYDTFTRFLVSICDQIGIKPTVIIDRITGGPEGRFYDMAVGFERLLLPNMRSPTPHALAKRLARSLGRIRKDNISRPCK